MFDIQYQSTKIFRKEEHKKAEAKSSFNKYKNTAATFPKSLEPEKRIYQTFKIRT